MSVFEYARRDAQEQRRRRRKTRGPAGGLAELRQWLQSPAGDEFLDSAVLGDLPDYLAEEVAADYGLELEREEDRKTFHRELDRALMEPAA